MRDLDQEAVVLDGLVDSLGFLLRIAQVRSYERFYHRFAAEGLRPGEFSVMWTIYRNPGIRPSRLCAALSIKPAHMTKLLRRLEDRGLVSRVVPDDDRRSVLLTVTEAGEGWIMAKKDAFFGIDDYHQHDLTDAEEAELARLLRKYSRT